LNRSASAYIPDMEKIREALGPEALRLRNPELALLYQCKEATAQLEIEMVHALAARPAGMFAIKCC
jgi:hypothetical protein